MSKEIDFAIERHQKLKNEKEEKRHNILSNKLKPKGHKMLESTKKN